MPLPLSDVPLRLQTSASGMIKRHAAQRQAAESMKPALDLFLQDEWTVTRDVSEIWFIERTRKLKYSS